MNNNDYLDLGTGLALIKSVAGLNNISAAVTAAEAAQTAAETAQGKAETAQGKAEDAQTAAEAVPLTQLLRMNTARQLYTLSAIIACTTEHFTVARQLLRQAKAGRLDTGQRLKLETSYGT